MGAIKKAYAITDPVIGFVSLVNKAANKQRFLITKAENGDAQFTTTGTIVKSDAEKHYITGIVYEPMTEDAHGNYMTEDDIVKAAYSFAKGGYKIDLQHDFEPMEGASLVESWIEKSDTTIENFPIKKGTWLMTVEITDEDVWDAVEKGELTGFSMGGVGKYSAIDEDISALEKSESPAEQRGIFARIAKALGFDVVEKGTVADKFKQKTQSTLFWDAWYSLQETLCRWNYYTDRNEFESNEETVKNALEEFSNIVTDILVEKNLTKSLLPAEGQIAKAGKKISTKNRAALQNVYDSLGTFLTETADAEKEEKEMEAKTVQKMIDDAIKKALEPQGEPAPAEPTPAEGDTPITEETVAKMVADAVQKAVSAPAPVAKEETPITAENIAAVIDDAVQKAMEPVLKAKGLPVNLNTEGDVKKSEEPHYMTGMF